MGFTTHPFYIMRGKFEFREPLLEDEAGLYITAGQMQFFLNRPKGEDMFKNESDEFLTYYNQCRLYNLIYDMMDNDPKCAKMYWDPKKEAVSITFPVKGRVALALEAEASLYEDNSEDIDW